MTDLDAIALDVARYMGTTQEEARRAIRIALGECEMPFKSQAQRRFMYARHPVIARRWQRHTPNGQRLPMVVRKAPRKRRRKR